MVTFHDAPEFESVEAFVASILDDDRTSYLPEELRALAFRLRRSTPELATELKSYGLSVEVVQRRGYHGGHCHAARVAARVPGWR